MVKNKTVEEYREKGAKAPRLSWFLDKTSVYMTFLVVGLLGLAFILYSGYSSFQAMSAPPEDESPYRDTVPTDFLGQRFAADLIQQYPEEHSGGQEWEYDEKPRQARLLGDVNLCPKLDGNISSSLLSSFQGSTDDNSIVVHAQIYGAGQARPHFEKIREIIQSCTTTNVGTTETDVEFEVLKYADSAIFTAGDSIVEINVNNENTDNKEDILNFYADYAAESLQSDKWQCKNLTPSIQDRSRSYYFDFDNYEGLYETELLEAETETENLPTPVYVREGNEVATSNINTISQPEKEAPEAPLPDDFKDVPKEPNRPALPREFEKQDDFSDRAKYEIADIHGPGCGWEWTAQLPPDYDMEVLEHLQDKTIVETQNKLEQNAHDYVFNAFDYSLRVMKQEPIISQWNKYVNTVDSIHESWDWLENERQVLLPRWNEYLEQHRQWRAFPGQQREAQERYNGLLDTYEERLESYEDDYEDYVDNREQCLLQREEVDEWEEEWGERVRNGEALLEGDETPSPSPSQTSEEDETEPEEELPVAPERPEDCLTLPSEPAVPEQPTKPSILDESRGSEPQPPAIPEGVTVPDSWENPAQTTED